MEGEEVEPYVVVAIAPNKPKEKNGLEFKKGQIITVEKVNKDSAMCFGFYGKKEGWFADYFVKKTEGVPEQRKLKPSKSKVTVPPRPTHPSQGRDTAPPTGGSPAPPDPSSKPTKKEIVEQKKQEKAALLEKEKKERADKREAQKKKKQEKRKSSTKKGSTSAAAAKKTEETIIPAIIENTVAYLEQPERLKLEGLFRVSGSLTDVKMIKEQFLKGKKVDLDKVHDPHTVAGVLKIFFRESKDPLLTFELYDCWVAAVATQTVKDRIKSVRQVIDMMPAVNKKILTRLMGLLANVARYEKENKMSVNNIAIVFAPTLLRPPGDQIDIAIQDSSYANHLIKFMIEEFDALFSESPPVTPAPEPARPAAKTMSAATAPPPGDENDFDQRLRRGSLLLARGSFVGGLNSFQELEEKMREEADEGSDASIDLSVEEIEGPGSAGSEGESDEGDLSDEGAMSMEEMMDKILEGRVNEVDDFLSTLDPDVAASTKKNLLERIDALMQSEDFKD